MDSKICFTNLFLLSLFATQIFGRPSNESLLVKQRIENEEFQSNIIERELSLTIRKERSNPLCINRKDILGESNNVDEKDVDCIPLTQNDREEVLRIETVLNSFPNLDNDDKEVESKGSEELQEANLVLKSPKNKTLKQKERKEVKINKDPLQIFSEDLAEGSGAVEEEIEQLLGGIKEAATPSTTEKVQIIQSFRPDEKTIMKKPKMTTKLNVNSSASIMLETIEGLNGTENVTNENGTDFSLLAFAPGFEVIETPISAAAKHKVFSAGNSHLSSIVAGWAAGFFGTFTIMAIAAMIVKNREKKRRKHKKKDNYVEILEMT